MDLIKYEKLKNKAIRNKNYEIISEEECYLMELAIEEFKLSEMYKITLKTKNINQYKLILDSLIKKEILTRYNVQIIEELKENVKIFVIFLY
ncbi:MAG: hypothetical protein ACOX5E_02600 [Bacilli bacterium]